MDTTDATDTAAAAHLHWCEMRNLSPETLRQRRDALRRLAAVVTDPATADEGDLACWWESIAHLHPQSRTTYLAHVRGFYRWATIEGLRADDPTRRLMRPRIPRAVPRPVSDSDVALALAATSDRVRPWVALAAFAGLRCAEIAGLRGEEVHRDADPPVVVVATGKGDRDRVVPWAATLDRFVAVPRHGLVFARLDGQPGPNSPGRVSAVASEELRSVGIAATLHQFRHRFATATYAACGDIRVVQELMGHASPTTTAVYAAWSREVAHRAVSAAAALTV